MVTVVLVGGSNVESLNAMVVKCGALQRGLVHDHLTSCRGEGVSVVVKVTVDKSVG